MTTNRAKTSDVIGGGLIANSTPNTEALKATGKYIVECFDKDGNPKWTAESKNLVVNAGLQYMAGTALTVTTQITAWYIGIYGAAASNTPAATDTAASHAGWTEITSYTEANRPVANFAAATNANPSVVTNTANKAVFTISAASTVIGGAFLISNNTKGGTVGTLFSAADFQAPGDRSVVNGDILNVTYQFSLSA